MYPNPAHRHSSTTSPLCPCNLPFKTKQGRTRNKKEKERNISLAVEVWCGPGSHTHISLFTPFTLFASVHWHKSSIWFHSSRPWKWLTNISFKIPFYPVNKWSHFSFPEILHSLALSCVYFSFLSSLDAPYCLQASTAASVSGSQLGQIEVDYRMRTAYWSSVIEGTCQFSRGLFHCVLRTHLLRILSCVQCHGACFIQTDVSVSPLMLQYSWSLLLLLPLTLPTLLKPQFVLH